MDAGIYRVNENDLLISDEGFNFFQRNEGLDLKIGSLKLKLLLKIEIWSKNPPKSQLLQN